MPSLRATAKQSRLSRRCAAQVWIAHMGILASMVDFSFSCRGFFDVAEAEFRRDLDGRRAPSSSWKPVFPAARGCQGAKLAGGDAHGAPLTAPSRRKSYEHEIEGAAVGRRWRDCADQRGFQRFMSFASGCSNPSILGRASRAFWSIAGTISHSVVAFQRPHPDSAFAGGRLGRASPLFATAFQAQQSIGSPTRIDRG